MRKGLFSGGKSKTVACFYRFLAGVRDNVFSIQRTEAKEIENGCLRLSCDIPRGIQWTRPFSKSKKFYCLSTVM